MRFSELDRKMRVYETAHDFCVLPGIHMVARLDGRGFTKLLRERHGFDAPFDPRFRDMMVETTVRGTARRAFRTRGGRPLLAGVPVSGKTGSLNGTDPKGRYEWFIGVAPAGEPKLVVATVAVQGPRWWWSASQLAADVLRKAFCPKGRCSPDAVDRFTSPGPTESASQPGKSSGGRRPQAAMKGGRRAHS